ncbi:hypothetical protein CTI12_AA560990 [Artemisia annua]|uniref:Uncharacterized protein n=1 Tax=Artemisia annua TaxID=35608 RepID=A0A2U1KV54_ARTAN|nr:hypothetical protein CTI12_AA560990 [Artemisia annua]
MFDFNPQFSNNQNHNNYSSNNFNHHGTNNNRHRFNRNNVSGSGVDHQFSLETMEEENSGVCSPPLWRNTSPPDSPVRHTNHGVLSPASRAQAIARGKREIMEMVQNMPETSYELSLKDLVEQRNEFLDTSHVDETQSMEENEERSILRGSNNNYKKKASVKRQESNKTGKIVVRNGSTNHNKGLFINMFFPFSVGSKKKKTSITTSLSFGKDSIKYSPKPELFEKSSGGDRRDWWWKKYTGSGDSESLGITSSSSGDSTRRSGSSGSSGSSAAGSLHSNSNRKNNDCSYGCWSFFPSRKRKS